MLDGQEEALLPLQLRAFSLPLVQALRVADRKLNLQGLPLLRGQHLDLFELGVIRLHLL